jgi:hypothetical protein
MPHYCSEEIKTYDMSYNYSDPDMNYTYTAHLVECQQLEPLPSCSAAAGPSESADFASSATAGPSTSMASSSATASIAGAVAGSLGGTGMQVTFLFEPLLSYQLTCWQWTESALLSNN